MTGDAPSVEQERRSKSRMRRVLLFVEGGHPQKRISYSCFCASRQIGRYQSAYSARFCASSSTAVVGYSFGRM
jgi:hypothetical protein